MKRYFLTIQARREMFAAWIYIADDSVLHADLVEEAIYRTCRLAAEMPEAGHRRMDVRDPRMRFMTVTEYPNYSIGYRLRTEPLMVVRVIHGARNVARLLR